MTKRWLVVFALLAAPAVLAQSADDTADNEAWIPLEDLPPDDQAAALDAEEVDRDKRAAGPEWSEATDQLVAHAIWAAAVSEVGVDLLPGTP